MSPSIFKLRCGAVIVSDAHYSSKQTEFLEFLKAIESEAIKTPQLILMGDIFDLLFGYISLTQERNHSVIDLINRLAQNIEILYLEGNHDFQLKEIFPELHVISIQDQPLICHYENKKVCLAHGDYRGDWKYRLYLILIRSSFILKLLSSIDSLSNHAIIKWLDSYLSAKDESYVIEDFQKKIESNMTLFKSYGCDYIIEGHFHQNITFKFENLEYINLAAFACNQRYFIVQSINKRKLLQEVIFNKELI